MDGLVKLWDLPGGKESNERRRSTRKGIDVISPIARAFLRAAIVFSVGAITGAGLRLGCVVAITRFWN